MTIVESSLPDMPDRLSQANIPQRTVGTIGSVWQKSTPSKETTGPAKRYENEQSEMRNGARAALA